jgi:hypothetical protein
LLPRFPPTAQQLSEAIGHARGRRRLRGRRNHRALAGRLILLHFDDPASVLAEEVARDGYLEELTGQARRLGAMPYIQELAAAWAHVPSTTG